MLTVAFAFARWSSGALGKVAGVGMIALLVALSLSIGLSPEASGVESDTFVTIRLPEAMNEDELMDFANQRIAVDPGFAPIRLTGNIFRFRLDSGLSRDSALCELRGEGLLVNPVVVLGNDRYLSYADRIVVKPKLGVTETQLAALDSAIGCVALAGAATWPSQYFATVLDSKGRSCIDIAAQYMASGNCVKAYPEEFITPLFTSFPGDLRSLQWPLENRGVGGWPDADIDAAHAWQVTTGNPLIKVAILDATFAWHPDADTSLLSFHWFGAPNWNGPVASLLCNETDTATYADKCGHGTGVLGIMAGVHNEFGIDGIAPHCSYTGVRIGRDDFSVSDSLISADLKWAAFTLGAKIIVNSWLIESTLVVNWDSTRSALQQLRNTAHAAVFWAAGNNGGPISSWAFASDPNVFTIGATNRYDLPWSYSNTGPELDFVAPAGNRSTTCPLGGDEASWDLGTAAGLAPTCNPYGSLCRPQVDTMGIRNIYTCGIGGTSSACPKAAGVAALVLSRHPDFLDSSDVGLILYNVLKSSAQWGGSVQDSQYGWGRVNAARALALLETPGDANFDGVHSIVDLTMLVNVAFRNSCFPLYNAAGDLNCDGVESVNDVTRMVDVIFRNEPVTENIVPCKDDLGSYMCCPTPRLIQPPDGSTGVSRPVRFSWEPLYWASDYRIDVDTSRSFESPIVSRYTGGNPYDTVGGLSENTRYYWRVAVTGVDCMSKSTVVWTFTTGPSSPMYEVIPNEVIVESQQVPCGTDSVVVGIRISNAVPLSALVLPLEIRALSGNGEFHSPVEFRIKNRLVDKLDSYSPMAQYLPEQDASGSACDGVGYSTRGDFEGSDDESPDAVAFLGIATEDALMLPEGSDDVGEPSLELVFNVSGFQGSFEIDTTCISPANHLLFIDGSQIDNTVAIAPDFTKGTITVGGIGALSGHVTACDTLGCEVVFTGNVIVDTGASLTILPSARISVADSAKLDVFGDLMFDTSGQGRPEFSCEGGVWQGITIRGGASVDWGRGCVIENAITAVTIAPGAASIDIRNVIVNNPSTTAFELSESVRLVNDTVNASGADFGVFVYACDAIVDSLAISGCQTGIMAMGSSGFLRGNSIYGPGEFGIHVYTDAENPGEDTLKLDDNTVAGHFYGAHFCAEPSAHSLIDSCDFLTDAVDSLQSHYGVKAYDDAWVHIRYSTILNCDTAIYSYNSKAEFGAGSSSGYNSIRRDSCGGSCPGSKVVAICELDFMGGEGEGEGSQTDGLGGPPPPDPICLLKAEGNWWGSSSPSSSWFTNIDYNPWLNQNPLGKAAVWAESEAGVPESHGITISNYPNPFNSTTEIEFVLPQSGRVRIDVYNVLGQVVKTLADRDYEQGTHRVAWDGTGKNSESVASGVYLYRIMAGDLTTSKKMLLLK